MLSRLPHEIQLLTARHCSVSALFKMRQLSRQLCHISSTRTVRADISVICDDQSTRAISTDVSIEWETIDVCLMIPLIYDMDDYEDVGPLGPFYLPLNILRDCEQRVRQRFAARGTALPAPRMSIAWKELELTAPINPAGALGYAMTRQTFETLRCTVMAAVVWPCLPKKMEISVSKVLCDCTDTLH